MQRDEWGLARRPPWAWTVLRAPLVGVLLLVGHGCAPTLHRVDPASARTLFTYLEIGKTTKAEAVDRLGGPSAEFEGGRILTFRLRLDRGKGDRVEAVVAPREVDPEDARFSRWTRATHSLVLVFDQERVLVRFGLLEVK